MWENLKNDPFFRVVMVAVIGILAFGLLFNLFSGQGGFLGFGGYPSGGMMAGEGHMGSGSGYGLTYGSLISWLLALLIKLLIFILVVAVVLGIFTWFRSFIAKDSNAPWLQSIKSDPFLRTISVITLAILGLVLVSGIFGSVTGYGMGGYNPMYGIAGLLAALIRLLSYILVISLIVAAVMYTKKQYESGSVNLFGTNAPSNSTGTNTAAAIIVSPTGIDKTANNHVENELKAKNDKPL